MERINLYKSIKTIIICLAALSFILSSTISCKKTTTKPMPKTGTIRYTSTQTIFRVVTVITPLLPVLTGDKPVGFSIIPALPTGLIFNTNTGAISGLPTVVTGATVYTITASYIGGTTTNTTINITVVPVVTTFAGNGQIGHADGVSAAASFNNPAGVAVDAAGNVYVADINNNLIRKITSSGLVSTFAGNGQPGYTNGMGATASFSRPSGVAVDATGNVYVADFNNSVIRKITPDGMVTTFAGNGQANVVDGTGLAASFWNPRGIAVDAKNDIYITEIDGNVIRKITPDGLVSTFAGRGGLQGSTNGASTDASFNNPAGVAVDAAGNVYVADWGNNLIRKILL